MTTSAWGYERQASDEQPGYAMPAAGWAAKSGQPVLWVTRDGIHFVHGVRLAESELEEVRGRGAPIDAFGFVGNDDDLLAELTQRLRNEVVRRLHALARVDEEQDAVCLLDGAQRLLRHQLLDALRVDNEAADVLYHLAVLLRERGQGFGSHVAGDQLLGPRDPVPVAGHRLEGVVDVDGRVAEMLDLLEDRVGQTADIIVAGEQQERQAVGSDDAAPGGAALPVT